MSAASKSAVASTTPQRSVFKRLRDSRLVKIDPTDLEAVAWAKSRIAQLYKHTRPETPIRSNRRFRELEIIFVNYWRGIQLPDVDAGRASTSRRATSYCPVGASGLEGLAHRMIQHSCKTLPA
jgi:hypothetical protein